MPTSGTRKPRGKTSSAPPRPGGRVPVDSKTRKRVVQLATTPDDAGKRRTRNAIAKLVGISTSTVSRIMVEDGPADFSWTAAAQARTASTVAVLDAKARRQNLAGGLLDDLDKIRGMFFGDIERVHFSVTLGKSSYTSPANAGELKDLAIAFGVLVDKHLVLTRADTDDRDLAAVDQWLAAMGGDEAPVVSA